MINTGGRSLRLWLAEMISASWRIRHTGLMSRTHRVGYLANRAKLRYEGVLCGICGEEIDLSLPRKDPMSFSADHIIPAEQGGSDHADNLMAAHLGCNQRRQAKPLDQVRVDRHSRKHY
jgi:5-methylcytosine-specific restriction endonuclease McrA